MVITLSLHKNGFVSESKCSTLFLSQGMSRVDLLAAAFVPVRNMPQYGQVFFPGEAFPAYSYVCEKGQCSIFQVLHFWIGSWSCLKK
jgi:hypothetical protein